MIGKIKYRWILVLSQIGNALGLMLFPMTNNYFLQCVARFMSGFFQMMNCIYFPNFLDTYSTSENKQKYISLGMAASPLGVISGYGVTYLIMNAYNWQTSFFSQGFFFLVMSFLIFFLPSEYIEID
jgi:predicted MFS family arabinose efflux permease